MEGAFTWLVGLDKVLFMYLRALLGGPWVDSVVPYLGNFFLWMPLVAFLIVAVVSAPGQRMAGLNLLYGTGALVLSFQICFMLSNWVAQPAPYVVEAILGHPALPSSPPEGYVFTNHDYSFPDWETASLSALLLFSRRRLSDFGIYLGKWVWISIAIIGISRVLAGYAYPYDVVGAVIVGWVVGWAMLVFARNMELVTSPLMGEHPAGKDSDEHPPQESKEN
jgi:membrane-associated phospholipid phosphatase